MPDTHTVLATHVLTRKHKMCREVIVQACLDIVQASSQRRSSSMLRLLAVVRLGCTAAGLGSTARRSAACNAAITSSSASSLFCRNCREWTASLHGWQNRQFNLTTDHLTGTCKHMRPRIRARSGKVLMQKHTVWQTNCWTCKLAFKRKQQLQDARNEVV